MPNKKQELVPLTDEQKALLDDSFPVSTDSARLTLPRFGMLAKDITEETGSGKTKKITVIEAAGTFYTESDKGEVDEETGKTVWTREYIEGDKVEVNITFFRYQLKKYDDGLKKFYSTPVYDNDTQELPLYLDKQIIKRGTEKFLQGLYPKLTAKGKPSSDLQKLTLLYILYKGELHQFNLSVSSGWQFSTYKRSLNPSAVVTELSSIEETHGSNTYRKTTFKNLRPISGDDFETIKESQDQIKTVVESDSRFLLAAPQEKSVEEEYDKL